MTLGTASTDWQDEIYRTAFGQEHNFSVSGKVKQNAPYRLSVGYTNQNGVIRTNNYERFTFNGGISPKFFDNHLTVDLNLKVSYENNKKVDESVVNNALRYDPTRPVKTGSATAATDPGLGYFIWMNGNSPMAIQTDNPVAQLDLQDIRNKVTRSIGNASFNYKVHHLEDLQLNMNLGYDVLTSKYSKEVPELAGNTNPKLITEIIKQCFAAGAKEVTVFDHTCDDWQKCYKNSGIEAAAKEAGAKVMPAHLESYYKPIDLPKGQKMKKAKVHEAILNCDVWINVPILKNHGGANLTISMKNHMGIVWDRGFFHQNDLQQCIADICTLEKKAVLNVVDAYRIMKTNGPRGRSESDVVLAKGLFISPDIVAVDTAAAKFFNQVREMPLDTVGHLAKGEALKIGTMNIDQLNVKRIKM